MKARVFRLESDEHAAARALLPWYATGALDAPDCLRVRDHLAACAGCRADLAWQQRLRAAASEQPLPSAPCDVDRGWTALARRIARNDAVPPRNDAVPPRNDAMAPRAGAGRDRRRVPGWPVAFGMQAALVAALAWAWLAAPPREQAFHALGPPATTASANVLVVFRPAASEADIRQALRASGAQFVAGPTLTDAYLLRLAPLSARALARLRTDPAVQRVDALEAATR